MPINGGEEQVGRKENTRNCSLAIANNRDEDVNGDEDEDDDKDEDEDAYKDDNEDDNEYEDEDDLQQAFFSSAPS